MFPCLYKLSPEAARILVRSLTLAKRAIVGLLNHRNRPTDTRHDREITAIPQIEVKQGAEKKLCPRSPPHMLQQVRQLRKFGDGFTMQHKDSEYLGEVEAELRTAVPEAIPPEERLRGLPPEERLRGLPPEERLRGLPPEEMFRGLSEDQAARLYELLERCRGS